MRHINYLDAVIAIAVGLDLVEDPGTTRKKVFWTSLRSKKPVPWEKIQLSKAERKGKTYEEIQEARFLKWQSVQDADAATCKKSQ